MNVRSVILLCGLLAVGASVVGCDEKAPAPGPDEPDPVDTAAPTNEPARKDPRVYMALVDRVLMKRQADVTRCTLTWKDRFPDHELTVDLMFELDPNGRITRVEASVPPEATDIGRCIEKVMAPTRFPTGAPPKPFKKTLVFNPQDQQLDDYRFRPDAGG